MLDTNYTDPDTDRKPDQHQNLVYEGLAVRNRKSPLIPRTFAYLTDIAIVTAIMYFVGAILFALVFAGSVGFLSIFSNDTASEIGSTLFVILIILAVLLLLSIYSGYFIYNEFKTGTTLGKRIFGLRVVSADGNKLTIGQCVLRDLLRIVDCHLLLPGFLAIRLTDDGKRLGDMVAGTLVVYSRAKERETHFIYVQSDTYNYYYEHLMPQPISREDAKLYLNYSYNTFISLTEVRDDISEYAKHLPQKHLTIPKDLVLTREDIELFFAEFCNQSTLDEKGI